jgi:hypothetical protein
MYFKFEGTYKSNRNCICGKGKECRKIQDAFRELNDIRGQTQKVPNPDIDAKGPVNQNKKHFIRRLTKHYSNTKVYLNEQSNKKSARKKDVYIALWHYDKQVLQRLDADETSVPTSVPAEYAKEAGIYQIKPGKLYTKADICPNILENRRNTGGQELLALVPTYFNIEDGLKDAEAAKVAKDCMAALDKASLSRGIRKASSNGTPIVKRRRTSGVPVPTLISNDEFFKLTDEEQKEVLDKLRQSIDAYVDFKNSELKLLATIQSETRQKSENLENALAEESRKPHRGTLPTFKDLVDLRNDSTKGR